MLTTTVSAVDATEISTISVAGAALAVSVLAAWYARRSAVASERSAEAADRSAKAAERQAEAAEASIPPPPPPIEWEIVPGSQIARYRLRNIGTEEATGVTIQSPDGRIAMYTRETAAKAGASLEFSVHNGGRQVFEVAVLWDGQEEPVNVPMPSKFSRRR